MTVDERFERIEHLTAGLAEESRKHREESRQLWRDTQRQINELTIRVSDLPGKVAGTNDAIVRLADESREADGRLGERIDSLVSTIGEFIAPK